MKFTTSLNKFASVAIAFVMILITQFGFVNSENITAQAITISNQDNEFKELINNSLEAWNSNKPENLAKFYAQEPELKFFDALPMQYQGVPIFLSIKSNPANYLLYNPIEKRRVLYILLFLSLIQ